MQPAAQPDDPLLHPEDSQPGLNHRIKSVAIVFHGDVQRAVQLLNAHGRVRRAGVAARVSQGFLDHAVDARALLFRQVVRNLGRIHLNLD